ncbi:MAG: hypothetical protein KDC10_04025 [Calditrichaeota bacterium]|nr:hypothetical protein [Calditrichota bacterium]MCB9473391.1 hypothetical protein [Candidatus Delongbacteria bacterium]
MMTKDASTGPRPGQSRLARLSEAQIRTLAVTLTLCAVLLMLLVAVLVQFPEIKDLVAPKPEDWIPFVTEHVVPPPPPIDTAQEEEAVEEQIESIPLPDLPSVVDEPDQPTAARTVQIASSPTSETATQIDDANPDRTVKSDAATVVAIGKSSSTQGALIESDDNGTGHGSDTDTDVTRSGSHIKKSKNDGTRIGHTLSGLSRGICDRNDPTMHLDERLAAELDWHNGDCLYQGEVMHEGVRWALFFCANQLTHSVSVLAVKDYNVHVQGKQIARLSRLRLVSGGEQMELSGYRSGNIQINTNGTWYCGLKDNSGTGGTALETKAMIENWWIAEGQR